MKNTFGNSVAVSIYGESHGAAVGALLDGLPAGIPVDEAFLAACMDKRRARGDVPAAAVHTASGVDGGARPRCGADALGGAGERAFRGQG